MTLKPPPKKIVFNEQIELRLISPMDGQAIHQGVVASLPELQRFLSWAHYDIDLSKAYATYAEFEASSLKGEGLHLAGFDIHTGEFLFVCSLLQGSRLNPCAFEIGYWVASKHAGKGIGTIAAKILICLAFNTYQADRVYVACNPDNERSLKVIENCGFLFEGTFRNHLMHPTEAMLDKGYSKVRDALIYSLIRDDLSSLSWFTEFQSKLFVLQFA